MRQYYQDVVGGGAVDYCGVVGGVAGFAGFVADFYAFGDSARDFEPGCLFEHHLFDLVADFPGYELTVVYVCQQLSYVSCPHHVLVVFIECCRGILEAIVYDCLRCVSVAEDEVVDFAYACGKVSVPEYFQQTVG